MRGFHRVGSAVLFFCFRGARVGGRHDLHRHEHTPSNRSVRGGAPASACSLSASSSSIRRRRRINWCAIAQGWQRQRFAADPVAIFGFQTARHGGRRHLPRATRAVDTNESCAQRRWRREDQSCRPLRLRVDYRAFTGSGAIRPRIVSMRDSIWKF